MKQFFLRLTTFILITAAVFLAVSAAYMGTQHTQYRMYREDILRYRDMPASIDIAVFGNSHPNCAFRAPYPELFRFSYDAQQLFGDKALYEAYHDRLSENAAVVFTLSDFSFEPDYSKTHELEFLRHYLIILPFDQLPLAKAKLYRVFRAIDFDTRDIVAFFGERINPDFRIEGTPYEEDLYEESLGDADSAPIAFPELNTAAPNAMSQANLEKAALLTSMIEDAIARGLRPVLLMTPLYQSYLGSLNAAEYRKTVLEAEAIAEEYGIPFYNFSQDERFISSPQYFKDESHLNQFGSEFFMPLFIEALDGKA